MTCELSSGAGVGCGALAPSTVFTWTTILCELVANAISMGYTITENEVDKIMIKNGKSSSSEWLGMTNFHNALRS